MRSTGPRIYFLYEDDKWWWTPYHSFDETSPMRTVPETTFVSGELAKSGVYENYIPIKENRDLIMSLENRNFIDGAMLIFDWDLGVSDVGVERSDTCQQIIGKEIIKIAQKIKQENKIDDAQVKADTGAENFECLVLQIAMQESGLRHCKSGEEGESCFDCDGEIDAVLKSAGDEVSYGAMQINKQIHDKVEVEDFVKNVEFGANYLIENYDSSKIKSYACASKSYVGWQRALRFYNGWNTNCDKGNVNYVEEVLEQKNKVVALFPECDEGEEVEGEEGGGEDEVSQDPQFDETGSGDPPW